MHDSFMCKVETLVKILQESKDLSQTDKSQHIFADDKEIDFFVKEYIQIQRISP